MATAEVFMSSKRYTDEFRAEVVKQVLERGFTVVDVAARIARTGSGSLFCHTGGRWDRRRMESGTFIGKNGVRYIFPTWPSAL